MRLGQDKERIAMGSFFFWVNWVLFVVLLFAPTLLFRCIERKRRKKV